MRAGPLLFLLLFVSERKLWSEEHGIGIEVPQGWSVRAGPGAETIALIEGPVLAGARPYGVLRTLGTSRLPLNELAQKVAASLQERSGRRVTARIRRQVGPFPAVRFGLNVEEGAGKGRGRLTLVRFGEEVFGLELSSAGARFPSGAYDLIERSLEVKWTEHRLPVGLSVRLPPGWTVGMQSESGFLLKGPIVGPGPATILVDKGGPRPELGPKEGEEAKGPMLRFLHRRHKTSREEKKKEDGTLVMVSFRAEPYNCGIIAPAEAFEDQLPVAAAILERTRALDKPGKKD